MTDTPPTTTASARRRNVAEPGLGRADGRTKGRRRSATGLMNDDDKSTMFDGSDGTEDRVSLGSLATPASVEAWITTSTTTDQDSIYNNGSATGSLDVGVTSGSVFVYRPGVAGSYFDTGALKVNDGVAHYVVYTYDGTTGKIFVDGVLRAQQAQGSGTVTAATYISYDGATSPGNGYFTGTIDEVATFSTALTCTGVSVVGDACTGGQIKTHFDRGRDFGLTIAESTANQHVPALTASSASRPTLFVGPGAAAATFTVTSNAADALDSPSDGITGVTFPALTGAKGGDTQVTAYPYEATYTWASPSSTASANVVIENSSPSTNESSTGTFTVTLDSAAPAGGALTVNGASSQRPPERRRRPPRRRSRSTSAPTHRGASATCRGPPLLDSYAGAATFDGTNCSGALATRRLSRRQSLAADSGGRQLLPLHLSPARTTSPTGPGLDGR